MEKLRVGQKNETPESRKKKHTTIYAYYEVDVNKEEEEKLPSRLRDIDNITTLRRREGKTLLGVEPKPSKIIPLRLKHCFVECSNTMKQRNKCGCHKQKIFKEIRIDMKQALKSFEN